MAKNSFFGTDGIRGLVGKSNINPEFILKLGWALGRVLLSKSANAKVVIGKDTRVSGYMLESALEAGLVAAGVDVQLLGPMPTPAVAYLTKTFRADAGVVISASHNPYYDNGIKIFNAKGMKLSHATEKEIEAMWHEPMQTVDSHDLGKAMRVDDAPGRYIELCKSVLPVRMRLDGLHIVLDCAHGAAYHIAPFVFQELGAKVTSIGVDPDGYNINKDVGATAMEQLTAVVIQEGANLGIALDGDADRVLMVDHTGEVVDGDELLAILVNFNRHLLGEACGVVGTLMTNLALEKWCKQEGVPFVRANVGDRFVMQACIERGWFLGGESSGHLINLHYTTTGDGIMSALQVLNAMLKSGKTLAELKNIITKCPQILINVPCEKPAECVQLEQVQLALQSSEALLGDAGRILLRASGTEPKVRVMVEGEDEQTISKVATALVDVVTAAAHECSSS